ncbi:sugar phosphate isomerase/epimerase family protein [Enterococcus gallinarum]|uniref:Sugar phosphate isomerase/epimerase family protein n=1 Tax=Enterococcus gallinarum TaxID=1353 RepID=A0ABD4ZRI0_ENTGA|nr:sugar phosphate isomerase/epimerase family protein [Enterococcus gallinarum]MBF0822406.1 sugar phosphate isomerase/epimerase [Enterococcus faecalis]MBF0724819.1 sugar phosphate isomerase/epimerase [Enterococcus gallinarum]MBF0796620.1 sugar phosphate isomerase/epimerase [Enterococcus gallinarum]MBX8977495.1 sugar phosphate isomerase/epimerase [Enterococcus gallinarum]MDL4874762.1 sugar phosphate isomerase/epimerase family protein [Enterococcus gallinarum]
MKLGIVSAIFDQSNFEEMIDIVAEKGLDCVEVACWPVEKAIRRYAGVSHIDVTNLNEQTAQKITDYAASKNVEISALAYYPNPLDEDLQKRQAAIDHLYRLIDAADLMGIHLVTTFIGRMQSKSLSENFTEMVRVWKPILKYAEEKNVRIAIENCPMLFTEDEWPGGQNLMTTPAIWREVFKRLDSPMLGLNYDPSHFVWQQIDYIAPLYEFKDKLFHVHYKDIKLYAEKLKDVGVMATPLNYMSPKLPGLGDVNWASYVSALTDIGFDGYSCIEIEDKAFEKNYEDVKKSVTLSTKYLRNFVL